MKMIAAGMTLFLLACSQGAAPPPDGSVDPRRLSLATFNVRNFFDQADDPKHSDDVPSAASVQKKITQLGHAVRNINADVIALQEVETLKLLNRLNNEELKSLGYKEIRLVEGNDVRGIDVALLSRLPLTRIDTHVKDTFKGVDGDTTTYGFSRDCLEVTMEPLPGRKLTLLINHLRASSYSNPTEGLGRRKAQAKRVREIADAVFKQRPDALLAVMGDLNDTPDSRTLQLLQTGAPRLIDLLTLVPASERHTTTYSSKKQFDYLLVSPALRADLVSGSIKANHGAVFSATSDHYPVIARFDIN